MAQTACEELATTYLKNKLLNNNYSFQLSDKTGYELVDLAEQIHSINKEPTIKPDVNNYRIHPKNNYKHKKDAKPFQKNREQNNGNTGYQKGNNYGTKNATPYKNRENKKFVYFIGKIKNSYIL